jgi:hypothetical protein
MLKRALNWLARLFGINSSQLPPAPRSDRRGNLSARYVARSDGEVPEQPAAGVLHLIADGSGKPWLAVMHCPCGCGAMIQLPMSPPARPCWHFRGTMQAPSLWPSVRRKAGCRSHFILRGGSVLWCREF